MKRIVILCDGTWNRSDSRTPTNVVQLAQVLSSFTPDGKAQIPIYIQGVGTGEGVTQLSKRLDRLLGGAFGLGLLENIEEAYRHLVFLYEPGDEIFIFGFSRGAYTARSLTGFIRSTGIVGRDALDTIPDAIKRYRILDKSEETHPSSDKSHAFRADISPSVVTSPKEVRWREENGKPAGHLLRIAFLGVWDSVGALGVPAHIPLLGEMAKRRYRFHDADLSSMVASARHAVALDEKRRSFEPTRWANVAELNDEAPNPSKMPYREYFFAGDHGSVGGGGEIRDLSSIALYWMIEGAQEAGLCFDTSRLEEIKKDREPLGPLRNSHDAPAGFFNWLTRLFPRDRKGPDKLSEIHGSVYTRWASDADQPYRPESLSSVQTEITAFLKKPENSSDTRIT